MFESVIREFVERQVEPEVEQLRHVSLKKAGNDALDRIRDGSFGSVLEPFKALDASLVEHVNQVRRYRNWVAHGRRPEGRPEVNITPTAAIERLNRFLDLIQNPAG